MLLKGIDIDKMKNDLIEMANDSFLKEILQYGSFSSELFEEYYYGETYNIIMWTPISIFKKINENKKFYQDEIKCLLENSGIESAGNCLKEVIIKVDSFSRSENKIDENINFCLEKSNSSLHKKVFIVHGRDNEAKQEVARYIESLGLEAIILHEKASNGMTIIEKIEHYAKEASFGIILYTPCDQGRGHHEKENKNRARQNVVFEHGYLMAKLGRNRVCALVKGEIETPNDINGVIYVSLDNSDSWKEQIKNELSIAGYDI